MTETFDQAEENRETLERITRLVRNIFAVDIAAISLIDGQWQRFKSIQGLSLTKIPLQESFCRAPWREAEAVVIPDTLENEEFRNHPLVTEGQRLRAYAGVPLKTSTGEIIGTLCAMHPAPVEFKDRAVLVLKDLAKIATAELELREHANTDALTGTMTRRAFFKEGARLHALMQRKELNISVVMLDIDRFKEVNDRYGHAAGDEVLRSIANACRVNLRECDLFGRLGGEEFAVVLEGNRLKALATAERLRAAIEALQFTFNEQNVCVTASFGIADVAQDNDTIEATLKRADAALYEAKAGGRNRIFVSPEAPPAMSLVS